MNSEDNSHDLEGFRPRLEAAVQAVLAEPIPVDSIDRVKSRAKEIAKKPPALQARLDGSRKNRSFPPLARLAVAAAIVATVTGAILMLDRSAGQVFAQAIEKVKAASSVRFTTSTQLGRTPEVDGQMFLESDRVRFEQLDGKAITVADLGREQVLHLDVQRKRAQLTDINEEVSRRFANPIEQLRHAKSEDAESIGQEILNGRRTQVYRLRDVDLLGIKGNGQSEMLVWVDVESELPSKIVFRDSDPKSPVEIRFERFVWNEPLDSRLFALNIPDGFERAVIVSPPNRNEPRDLDETAPEFVDGILRDRVPCRIVWEPQGTTITALMRDPESVSPQERRPNQLRQWDLKTGELQWSKNVAGASSVAGTVNGRFLATVIGYEVQLRRASSGKVSQKWVTDEPLTPLAFSPDGKTLAAGITEWGPYGGSGGNISGGFQLWDVESGSLQKSITDDKPVTFLKFAVDGKYLATSSNEGPVKLWDTATGELVRIFPGRSRADFSPDGKRIACVSATPSQDAKVGRIDLYSIEDASLVKSFVSEKGPSPSWLLWIAFSPDGQLLTAASWNGTVTIWDAKRGEVVKTLDDFHGGVHCAVFSPDGRFLAMGSEDETLRIWKVPVDISQQWWTE